MLFFVLGVSRSVIGVPGRVQCDINIAMHLVVFACDDITAIISHAVNINLPRSRRRLDRPNDEPRLKSNAAVTMITLFRYKLIMLPTSDGYILAWWVYWENYAED